ncbi:MAG: methylmalonyl-CoA epimerase [Calditrichaeota bacterium]|nr:MAG: methylmalonyl-CoA epimerase [Calditrichota bacterium]MBL1204082.1 methylmalonyl-CoA epimerase [Calditrichota bacterium]NOG43913.1 methylmalonyl-CoA epimerase [Calditrichota bacterium]
MLKKIDHIGIAVKDLNEIQETLLEGFDLSPEFSEHVKDQMVDVLGFHVGESTIEYLSPTSAESPIAKFIEKKGSGLHHIAYRVDNLQRTLDHLKNKGFRLIDESPRDGAEGKRIAFVHPKSSNGILIELCEEEKK